MGNDQSHIKGLHIDQNPIETTDYWTLYTGELTSGDRITSIAIYKGEPIVKGQLWATQSPLERTTKNLMIFRHPSILKYITSWERGSNKFLATEKCKPLIQDLPCQSNVQICLGLRSILCSLIFLVEQANARHLNICPAAIYVTPEGTWKLSGFEHLWKSSDITTNFLERWQQYRYKKSIDPRELKNGKHGIEQFAFAALCEEILKNCNEEMPHISDFRVYCSTHLKHSNPLLRPKLSAVLLHPFFNHEFITIHSFLTELPLKTQQEKQHFFTGLLDRLREFNEENVASQLAGLLLSRMVLLDSTAQLCVTPYLLRPRTDELFPALFSSHIFTKYFVPKIMNIFSVRDSQIRLILLEYFNYYVRFIPADDLKEQILPQLLLGIKDTNDVLVAATLRSLADLVNILGSAVVIGRNRNRIFSDGRPHGLPDTSTHWIEHRSITPVMNSSELVSGSPILDHVDISESYASPSNHLMPERPSPDGGEDIHTSSGVLEFEDDAWSDWEAETNPIRIDAEHKPLQQTTSDTIDLKTSITSHSSQQNLTTVSSTSNTVEPLNFIKDIKEMEIKTKTEINAEIDFFKDMEPIIQKANVLVIGNGTVDQDLNINANEKAPLNHLDRKDGLTTTEIVDKTRFEFKLNDTNADEEAAWDDDTNEWEND